MSAARAGARPKPVIVIKAGRHAESAARRGLAHRRAGRRGRGLRRRVPARRHAAGRSISSELFDAVETLRRAPRVAGDRLAILTNGGGLGILATDALLDRGGRLAELSAGDARAQLDAVLPRTWSHGNPVDIIGDAHARALRGGA